MKELNLEDVHRRIAEAVERMPPLSPSISKVITLANDLDSSPVDLLTVIKLDPVLTTKVLRLINSAWFDLGHPVTSIGRALVILGYNTIKNVALSSAVVGVLSNVPERSPASARLWSHSLWVGVAARTLMRVRSAPREDQEAAFIAGLLHDLGEIVLLGAVPDLYERIRQATQGGIGRLEAEAAIVGMTHQEIGGRLASRWGFPEAVRVCLEQHHAPPLEGPHAPLCCSVHVANAMYYHLSRGGDDLPAPLIDPRVWDVLGVDQGVALSALAQVSGEVEAAQVFLES